jgi:glyoxylase-like metal-dependent hydrolase (beta-lactamase superfamily II)
VDDWLEVGSGVFCRRYQPWDVTVGMVVGADGLLVIDTRASLRQADQLLDDVRRLSRRPVSWVVNTHAHFDHTYGNARFGTAECWGHRSVPPAMAVGSDEVPDDAEYAEVVVCPPDHLVDDTATIDLGDRTVELRHLGRGHTDGDLIVIVPEAELVFAGDLIEQSGPPAYGDDSFPLDWPVTVGHLHRLVEDQGRVVPGHGAVVDRPFVAQQQAALEQVADIIRGLWVAGVPAADALGAADRWPFPFSTTGLAQAVARGYQELAVSASGGSGG